MSNFQARFKQSPSERKRYVLDYTLFLAPAESIVSVATTIVQTAGAASPALIVNDMALLPPSNNQTYGAAYFVSGGAEGTYEVQFLATTSIGQVLEDVVQYTLQENL